MWNNHTLCGLQVIVLAYIEFYVKNIFCLVLLVYVSCICLTVWLIITITIYLQERPFTTMLYITQTKHNIQSTNISTNDMVLYW